jgi:hypothetical protein
MSERERKLTENEAVFRAFNEGVRDVEGRVGSGSTIEVVCECSDAHCDERIQLPVEEYADIRSNPVRFAVKVGHDVAAVEEILRQGDAYAVIEKRSGHAADIARDQSVG